MVSASATSTGLSPDVGGVFGGVARLAAAAAPTSRVTPSVSARETVRFVAVASPAVAAGRHGFEQVGLVAEQVPVLLHLAEPFW